MYNKAAMKALKKLLLEKFPESISKIILFGSRIENRENVYSDYDILIILKEHYDWKFEKELKLAAYDVNIDYDILTDINLIDNDELQGIKGNLPFIQDALAKGVEL